MLTYEEMKIHRENRELFASCVEDVFEAWDERSRIYLNPSENATSAEEPSAEEPREQKPDSYPCFSDNGEVSNLPSFQSAKESFIEYFRETGSKSLRYIYSY